MKLELFNYAFTNVLHRKTRSWLTVLSILIGIMAIFALVSFGLGIQKYVDDLSEEAGANKIFIQSKSASAPGTDQSFFISKDELDFVKKIKGVDQATGMYMKPAKVEHNHVTKYFFLMGSDPKDNDFVQESFGIDTVTGRPLKQDEIQKVVLGYNYQIPDKIFRRPIEIGERILINDVSHEVIGFVSLVGNPQDDSNLYLSEKGMEFLYPDVVGKYAVVMAQAEPGIDPKGLADKIEEKLRKYKSQEEGKEDFYVQTFEDAIATFTSIIDIINGVLVLIAFISLIVAAVNIMNTMYTAVLERTKEIGVMKAIGARNRDILMIFIIESGILGTVGGILGVFLGYLVAKAGGAYAAASGFSSLQPAFPLILIIGCIMFAFFVGAAAGLLPALQASRQKPVDALRYE